MTQTTDTHCAFPLPLLPLKTASHVANSFEVVEYTHNTQTLDSQHLGCLSPGTESPEACDNKAVIIVVLEGEGSLSSGDDTVPLEPGRFVFIPAEIPHQLQTQTSLICLLSRCESDLEIDESIWVINL